MCHINATSSTCDFKSNNTPQSTKMYSLGSVGYLRPSCRRTFKIIPSSKFLPYLALAGRVSFQSCTRFKTVAARSDSCGAVSALPAMLAVVPSVLVLVVPPTLFPAAAPALWPVVLQKNPACRTTSTASCGTSSAVACGITSKKAVCRTTSTAPCCTKSSR